MMKQKWVLSVLIFGLGIVLVACGGGAPASSPTSNTSSSGGGGNPADAAKGFYDGLYGDGNIDQYVCGSNKAAVDAIKQGVEASKKQMAAANTKIDVSGLKYETANQSGDSADVKVSGKIKMTASGNAMETDFPAVTLKMKNESGWKVCGAGV
jgi:hypothetical protein